MSRKFHRQIAKRSAYVERGVSSLGRGRHSFSRKRRFPWKPIGLVVLFLCFVGGGVLTAHLLNQPKEPLTPDTSSVSTTATTTVVTTTTATEAPTKEAVLSVEHTRAFYMTTDTLCDKQARTKQLSAAADAGMTGVVFDLKDAEGNVYYASATDGAKKVGAVTKGALTLDTLREFLGECSEKGLLCIPRLYCFEDSTAAAKLSAARVLLAEDPALMWLDDSASRGGKPWLNPYSPEAHNYLKAYVSELSKLGFSAVMLDGVQFPNQLYAASFGSTSLTSLSKGEVLAKFVDEMKAAAGKATVIVSAPGLSVTGNNTAAFGGNPLQFGADVIAPKLLPSTFGNKLTFGKKTLTSPAGHPKQAVEMAFSQVSGRIELLSESARPNAVLPFVEVDGYKAAEVTEQITAVTKQAADAPFVLYSQTGIYAFETYFS